MSNFKDIFKNIFMPENTQNYDFTIDPNVKDKNEKTICYYLFNSGLQIP